MITNLLNRRVKVSNEEGYERNIDGVIVGVFEYPGCPFFLVELLNFDKGRLCKKNYDQVTMVGLPELA